MKQIDNKTKSKRRGRFFKVRAVSALGIAILADILDYVAAPLFGLPIIGDIFDFITTGILYFITRSKVSVLMNLVEFMPLGDFLPVYTISTLIWIFRESNFEQSMFVTNLIKSILKYR